MRSEWSWDSEGYALGDGGRESGCGGGSGERNGDGDGGTHVDDSRGYNRSVVVEKEFVN